MPEQIRDVFLCHASEDKPEVVRPLAKMLKQCRISCWYDEAEIKWGDSITEKVNEGLRLSRYVIVILSKSFISKNWPKREFNSVLNIESSSGQVKVLPLLVGDIEEQENIFAEFPLLSDKLFMTWDKNIDSIIEALQARLNNPERIVSRVNEPTNTGRPDIPLPRIRKNFTQRDKDLFLKESFIEIKEYFQHALLQLEAHYQEVETDFTEIHNFKFLSTIYVNGEVENKCKVWIGGMMSSDSIAYSEGNIDINNDNSYNGFLHIKDDGYQIYLEISDFGFGRTQDKNTNPTKAAEHLWKRFSSSLEY